MEKETWDYIEIFIRTVLKTVYHRLDTESVEAVEHYLSHEEYEMAFEILFIEIMKLNETPEIDLKKSKEIAQLLRLDEQTIFDVEFWSKFEDLVNNHSV